VLNGQLHLGCWEKRLRALGGPATVLAVFEADFEFLRNDSGASYDAFFFERLVAGFGRYESFRLLRG
jgi:hypothetical protein